jgi:Tol biopolymer transport system component
MIVFVALAGRIDQGPRGTRLYVSTADGRELRPLPGTHGADEPKFGPDNDAVVFTRYRFRRRVNRDGEGEFVPRGASIWTVDVSGGAPRRITPDRNGLWMFPASFSPDGSSLLASRFVGRGPWKVTKVQLDSGRTDVLLRRAADPVYSPDGKRIAFIRWRSVHIRSGPTETTTDLFTVKSDGGDLRQVTRSPGIEYSQSWDPSGERLAFVRYPPERIDPFELGYGSALLQVNVDGSCLRPILPASPLTAIFAAAWQPGPGREAGPIEC